MLDSTLDSGNTSNNTKPLLVQGERQHMDQYVKIHQHEKVLEQRKARRRDWLLGWGLQFPLDKLTEGFLIRFLLRREPKDLKKSNVVIPGNTLDISLGILRKQPYPEHAKQGEEW